MKTPDYIQFEAMLAETWNESDRAGASILANLYNWLSWALKPLSKWI
jgi:hypothetical protein